MASNGSASIVQFPGDPADPAAKDLADPVYQLLHKLNLLGSADDYAQDDSLKGLFATTAPSVAVIEQGATALTKVWSAILAVGITITGVVAAAQGVWGNEHDIVRVAIISGSAVVLAALSVSLGLIVQGDVRSRALGAVATIQVRGGIATKFLEMTRSPVFNATSKSPNGQAPAISNLVPTSFVAQTADAPGVPINVQFAGLDDRRNRWYVGLKAGQIIQVPESSISAAKPVG
jgi:hypothetical protein